MQNGQLFRINGKAFAIREVRWDTKQTPDGEGDLSISEVTITMREVLMVEDSIKALPPLLLK